MVGGDTLGTPSRVADNAGQGTLLLGKVLLVAYLMVELDRVREQSGKGGLSQVTG